MNEHEIFTHLEKEDMPEKLYGHQVYTGFPNQASDTLRADLDFNQYLILNRPATFTIRVSGNGMMVSNIYHGDLIIVDRSKSPVNGSIIVAVINNEFALKKFCKREGQIFLLPTKPGTKPYMVNSEDELQVWGVVSFIIHDARIKCNNT